MRLEGWLVRRRLPTPPGGEVLGERVCGEQAGEAEHFIKCPTSSGYIDMRDLAQVMEHEGPLPHPVGARPQ